MLCEKCGTKTIRWNIKLAGWIFLAVLLLASTIQIVTMGESEIIFTLLGVIFSIKLIVGKKKYFYICMKCDTKIG